VITSPRAFALTGEDSLLEGRHNCADLHEWLASRLPKGSRLSC
jgi:hypothetical protein